MESMQPAELIAVQIGDQRYAIDIMIIREIRGWTASTRLPQTPSHVLGMINLRGAVLPVIDLGARLGQGQTEQRPSSVVIVVEVRNRQVGLLVDAVCDVLKVGQGEMHQRPEIGEWDSREFVQGVICTETGLVTVLELDPILPEDVPEAA